jgi:hypothetical protein
MSVQPRPTRADSPSHAASDPHAPPARRPLWESRPGCEPEDPDGELPSLPTRQTWAGARTPDAHLWERYALAESLREEHGVDVAFAGPDAARPLQWTCNDCARRERGEVGIPSGRYCYKGMQGLIEHLRAVHDVFVY